MTAGPLRGTRVGVTAGRRGADLARALEEMGAAVSWGPTVESVCVPVERVVSEVRTALAACPAWVVVMTAAGLHRCVAVAGELRRPLVELLQRRPVAARGDKAARACADYGCLPALTPRSERYQEVVDLVVERAVPGEAVLVQADGGGCAQLAAGLTEAGLGVHLVRPFRWAPPTDASPAQRLVRSAVAGGLDVITLTSPPAVEGLFEIAADLGLDEALRTRLSDGVAVAAIGPATAEAVEERGVPVAVCPVRPRTAALLTALATARRLQRPRLALRLHPGDRTATVGDRRVALTDLEFFLLASLARRHGITCPTEVLVREVWGDEGERRRLEVLVSRLRGRLADLGLSIAAVPKRGYRLEPAS